jgi:hypothetical protein
LQHEEADREEDGEEEEQEVPKVTIKEALAALEAFTLYEQQQEDGKLDRIQGTSSV